MKSIVLAAVLLLSAVSFEVWAFDAQFLSASSADLENPHDVKLSPGGAWLFVSDVGNDRVVILDAERLQMIGHFGGDHQSGTHDVDFDAEGRLYVADTHNHRIGIYALEGTAGKLVAELSGAWRKPECVLVGPDGRVYVTGAGSGNLVVYEKGAVVKEMGGLSAPHDLEFAPGGDLWIADAANDRLVRTTPDLEIRTVLEGAPYHFSGPRYLDVAPDGTLVVADKYSHSIKVIAEDGRLLGVIGDGTSGKGPGKFRTPEGVELRGETAWIADSGNDRIVKYRITWD
jgi:DNA-binding beta-propeller fold protein YncE